MAKLTEVVCEHLLVIQGILRPESDKWWMGAQCVKALGFTLLATPLHLFLQDVEHRDNIAQAAASTLRRVVVNNLGLTYLFTSTLPNVKETRRTSTSSDFPENASRRARISSIPCDIS